MTAFSLSHQDRSSHRLWSLRDIMKPLNLTNFLTAVQAGGMQLIQTNVDQTFPNYSDPNNNVINVSLSSHIKFYQMLEEQCIDLEFRASLASVRKIQRVLADPNPTHKDLRPLEIELLGRLMDEMGEKFFWTLTTREAELYNRPRTGWVEIIDRFPDTVTDIEEAAKCFALARYAAAVFHSVQVVEVGLIELGKLIGVTDPLSGWTATTNRLQQIIKKGHDARTSFERQHFAFLEQMHGTIEGLKNAWRNKISHAQGKLTLLTADFSPDVAEEILFATRAFMRRLATDAPVPGD
jgi:hypothetical protein